MADRPPNAWPLSDLVLHVGDLTLRPLTELDLEGLGAAIPEDLEMNPHTPRPFGLAERASRAVALRQEYWSAMGSWHPSKWDLPFAVRLRQEVIGVQSLEAEDFAVLRTVETASWLLTDHRSKGLGKLARTAVLALAFDGLDAEVALTEAWADNEGSLGVSVSLGYQPNGSVRHRRGSTASEMPRLRLDRAGWFARKRPAVHVGGLAACLSWFIASS